MTPRNTLLRALAQDQLGLFTFAQAKACGLSSSTIADRTRTGTYERIHPGVYGVGGGAPSWRRDIMAAVLSTAEPGAASHRTAAYLWGLTDARPSVIEVVTRRYRRTPRSGVTVHESLDLRSSDVVRVDSVPVTSVARTVVDLGASSSRAVVARCLDSGLRQSLISLLDVELFVMRVGRSGRTGVGVIRPLLDERREWQGVAESELEDMFRRIVQRSSLTIPVAQHEVVDGDDRFVGRFDFAYPDTWSLFELDSEGWHMDPVSFQRDRDKQNRAHALGWTVYRFTYRQLRDTPETVLRVLASTSPDFRTR